MSNVIPPYNLQYAVLEYYCKYLLCIYVACVCDCTVSASTYTTRHVIFCTVVGTLQ